ncbi:tripartite tricarboxylate transporter TctB family protein [Alteribacillus sp. YIM 98480]|uniref:tripartite tricarboxylate transporter TctB family protein n=1 Tax=Alteribacillus sp. YIM 98480 TaxID=2606599 RepID=UPI00131D128D|nr:tripartite tricarboxylate transporter TctB family protein [Alteribacillus sp. YIM 98480]
MRVFSVLTIIFALFFLPFALELESSSEVSTIIGPRTWPLYILIFILVLAVYHLIKTELEKKRDQSAEDSNVDEYGESDHKQLGEEEKGWFENYRHFILLATIVIYCILINLLGFLPATFIFIAVCSIVLGLKNKLYVLITTVVGSFMIFMLFDYVLNIPLP